MKQFKKDHKRLKKLRNNNEKQKKIHQKKIKKKMKNNFLVKNFFWCFFLLIKINKINDYELFWKPAIINDLKYLKKSSKDVFFFNKKISNLFVLSCVIYDGAKFQSNSKIHVQCLNLPFFMIKAKMELKRPQQSNLTF